MKLGRQPNLPAIMILNNLRRFLILRSQRFRDGIWQAAELRTSHSQLTRNEHNPVVFIENQKASPAADWLFDLRSRHIAVQINLEI